MNTDAHVAQTLLACTIGLLLNVCNKLQRLIHVNKTCLTKQDASAKHVLYLTRLHPDVIQQGTAITVVFVHKCSLILCNIDTRFCCCLIHVRPLNLFHSSVKWFCRCVFLLHCPLEFWRLPVYHHENPAQNIKVPNVCVCVNIVQIVLVFNIIFLYAYEALSWRIRMK